MKLLPSPANTPAWLTLKPISGKLGEPTVAYQIVVNNPPFPIQKSCVKNPAGIWEIKSLENLKE
jgi:hypothetical protein